MTTPTLLAASPRPAPELDLDTRFLLVGIEMDARLNAVGIRFDVNTAHLATEAMATITDIVPLTPTLAPCPYNTPLAVTLHQARIRIETDGWHKGHLRDEYGTARCVIGAIRLEAATPHQADDACGLLLEAIQRDFPDAESIPSWNDSRTSPAPVLRALDRGAELAHARSL
jgi:hypothetical protein